MKIIHDKKIYYAFFSCFFLIISIASFAITSFMHKDDNLVINKKAEVDKTIIINNINKGIDINNKIVYEQLYR